MRQYVPTTKEVYKTLDKWTTADNLIKSIKDFAKENSVKLDEIWFDMDTTYDEGIRFRARTNRPLTNAELEQWKETNKQNDLNRAERLREDIKRASEELAKIEK
jgi:hypothetical protein